MESCCAIATFEIACAWVLVFELTDNCISDLNVRLYWLMIHKVNKIFFQGEEKLVTSYAK